MKLLKNRLREIYKDNAVVFDPVDIFEIKKTTIALMKQGLPKLPNDYAELLTLTDGLSWNGLVFFSIKEHQADEEFSFASFEKISVSFKDYPLLKGYLIVGYAPDELIGYHPATNEYHILARYDYRILLRLPRFYDVFFRYTSMVFGEPKEEDL